GAITGRTHLLGLRGHGPHPAGHLRRIEQRVEPAFEIRCARRSRRWGRGLRLNRADAQQRSKQDRRGDGLTHRTLRFCAADNASAAAMREDNLWVSEDLAV